MPRKRLLIPCSPIGASIPVPLLQQMRIAFASQTEYRTWREFASYIVQLGMATYGIPDMPACMTGEGESNAAPAEPSNA